jgi:DNA polymerase-3 subunit delta'
MLLFGSRDIESLGHFFSGDAHSTLLVRRGGFHASEVAWLQEQFLKGQEANLISLSPENGKKSVSVEQVRVLVASLSLGSRSSSERRLVVVNSKLGTQAQNALLKIVEEPPSGVYFLLLADNEDDYLATIKSRSQLIKLRGPTDDEVNIYLAKADLKGAEVSVLWLQSGENVARLIELTEDEKIKNKSLEYLADAKSFLKADEYGRIVVMKKYLGDKEEAAEFVKSLLVVAELICKKGAKEALTFAPLVKRLEECLRNLNLNTNLRMELLDLVV